MSLYKRAREELEEKRNRILSGKINCIPWGLKRFEDRLPGIEQGRYYLNTANSKVGKTQITDHLFVYNPIRQIIDDQLDVDLKIFYFTLEMTKEEKMIQAFSNILYVKEGIRIEPNDLLSKRNALAQTTLDLIDKYSHYFEKLEKHVEFIDDIKNPTGIYNFMREYANANGTQYKKTVDFKNNKTGEVFKKELDDYYQANDPEQYVMIIIDHIGLITPEKEGMKYLNLHESISKLSSNYLVRLRNKYNYIPVVIQQQASSQESLEQFKASKLKPTLAGLGDNKLTQRDANVILGLFSPFRHELPAYGNYDIKKFRDNIRFLEIVASRHGGNGTVCPLFFDGGVNFFRELPLSNDKESLEKVYKLLNTIPNRA